MTIARILAMVVSYLGAMFIAGALKVPVADRLFEGFMSRQAVDGMFTGLAEKAVLEAARGMAYSLLFFIAFVVLQFLLFRVIKALKLVDYVPVVGKLNKLGGALLGFLWVFLLCFLIGNVFFTYVPKQVQKEWGFTNKAVERTVLLQSFRP